MKGCWVSSRVATANGSSLGGRFSTLGMSFSRRVVVDWGVKNDSDMTWGCFWPCGYPTNAKVRFGSLPTRAPI